MVSDGFWEKGDFPDPVHVNNYVQQISFFHRISSFLTIAWCLLHCFHAEASFVVYLQFYNGDGDNGSTLTFHKSRFG